MKHSSSQKETFYLSSNKANNEWLMDSKEQLENMTETQMSVLLTLLADKFEGCENMEEVQIAVNDIRNLVAPIESHQITPGFHRG